MKYFNIKIFIFIINMTGGILQLVAYGVQDIFLTENPQITFFKTVYRRHTNFSKEEFDLKFNNNLDFGKEAICKIARYGDLLHRLFLVIRLPSITAKYNNSTNAQILELIKNYDIDWNTSINSKCKFNNASYEELDNIISNKITGYQNKIIILDNINNNNKNIDTILSYCEPDVKLLYDTINNKLQNEQLYKLYSINDIKNSLTSNIFNNIILDTKSYNHENIKFIHNLELADNASQFDKKINNIYNNSIPVYLDAFKIYNTYQNKIKINTNVQHVMKTIIINNMLYTLNNNPKILSNIYETLTNNIKCGFYRKTQNNNKNTKLIFNNIFQFNNNNIFDDNFTNNLYINTNNNVNINCPFTDHINANIKIFHNNNINIFNNKYFDEYFNDIKLWSRTNLELPGDCHLDIDNIYNIKMDNINGIYCFGLIPFFTNNDICTAIKKYINLHYEESDKETLIDGINVVKNIVYDKIKFILDDIINEQQIIKHLQNTNIINNTDIPNYIYMCIIKKYIIDDIPIQKYIINKYIEFANNNTNNNTNYKSTILDIINLFVLDKPENLIPYNIFIRNNQNIKTNYLLNPINNNNKNHYLSFGISSIWYYITNSIIDNYNKFYNNILDTNFIGDKIGGEILSYIKHINKYYTNNTTDYWNINTININKITKYLSIKIKNTTHCINGYNNNLDQLKKINTTQPENLIKNNTEYKTIDNIYINLLDEFSELNNKNITDKIHEILKNKINNKINNNNNIDTNIKLYSYMLDYILNNWTPIKYINEKNNMIKKIDNLITIQNKLKKDNTLSEQNANFAWISKIGFYIIDNVSVTIGGQLMDKHTGEWLNIWHELTKEKSKERGYNKLIGNIKELTDFNKIPKKTFELIVPLNFWFCKQLGLSLPLVALLHTDIEISVKMKQFNEVSYADPNVYYTSTPKLSCYMMGEYIFIEGEERSRIAKSKLEYLIETIESTDEYLITSDTFKLPVSDIIEGQQANNLIRQKIYFLNPVKEVIWILQDTSYVDKSKPNGEMKYYNYSSNFNTDKGNTINYVKIQFSGRDRQIYMNNIYYNYIIPYQHHNSTPSDGIYTYSFSLSPEIYQPSGSANFSKIDDFYLIIQLSDNIYQQVINNNLNLRFKMYGTSYNILRIMSGQAGLAFYK